MPRLVLTLLLVAVTLALAACGGGESDEDQISSAIVTLATNTEPANCQALATLAFLEQVEYEEGKAAIKACEKDAKESGNDAKSVDVADVEVDGSTATATASFEGGGLDGQTLTIDLVEEDGEWKLDRLAGFVKFDRRKLVEGLEKAASANRIEGIEPDCIIEGIEEFTDAELEELVLDGLPEALVEVAEGCV